jgi:hypothetical protein
MVDWNTGAVNPRFQVTALLKHNFAVGDKLVSTSTNTPAVFSLGFIGQDGEHKLLLVNKRDRSIELTLPQMAKEVQFVDETTQSSPPVARELNESEYQLGALGVAVLTLQP